MHTSNGHCRLLVRYSSLWEIVHLTCCGKASSLRHDKNGHSPKHNTYGHDLLCWETTNQPSAGILSKEVASIDH